MKPLWILMALVVAACTPKAPPAPAPEAAAPEAPAQEAPAKKPGSLPGTWVSVEDPKSVVRITESQFIEIYDGTDEMASSITWVTTCEGAPPEAPGPFLLVTDDDLERCFAIQYIDATRLELVYMGRGNTLAYTRLAE